MDIMLQYQFQVDKDKSWPMKSIFNDLCLSKIVLTKSILSPKQMKEMTFARNAVFVNIKLNWNEL